MTSAALRPASPWIRAGLALGAGAALVLVLVLGAGARLEAPTVGLAVALVALLFALHRLYALVAALTGAAAPGGGGDLRTQAELRDEKRRLLRALKELEFDHGMGKLSRADYDAVSAVYKMRAIEVMRALDGNAEFHPALRALLDARAAAAGGAGEGAAAPAAPAAPAISMSQQTCAKCQTSNDADARFCKGCGAELRAS